MCPHSTRSDARPETCSLCAGITPRRVDQDGASLTIDGKTVRAVAEPEISGRDYYKRGGRRGGPAKARKHAEAAAQPVTEPGALPLLEEDGCAGSEE